MTIMKKNMLLCLIITILLSGCASSVSESETSAGQTVSSSEAGGISSESYDRFRAGTYATFAETDDYYFWKGAGLKYQMIHYYEKSSGASGFLCFKPECRHDDRSCDAYVGRECLRGSLAVREGMLYWIGVDVNAVEPEEKRASFGVWRMRIDGTGREFYGPTDYDELVNYQFQSAYLWGDFYYFAGIAGLYLPGGTSEFIDRITLTRVPISGGAVELLAEFSDVNNASTPMTLLGTDSVYLFTGGHEKKSHGGYTYSLTLLQYHIAANKVEILLKNQEMKDGSSEVRLHSEKGILVTPMNIKADGEDHPGDPLLYILSDGQLTPWLDFSDSIYEWMYVMEEGLLLMRPENGEYAYELRDMEGYAISSGTILLPFLSSKPPGFVAVWGDSREFFIEIENLDTRTHYLVRYRVTPEGLQETLLMQAGDEALTE